MGVIVKCKQQKKQQQYSGNLTAYQRQQRASFSKTRAMLTVQLSIIKENIVVFKKRNNVIYVKHGGLFVHPASRNTWYQAWRGTVMSIFTELKGSQALRDRVAPVHGVIIVWLGILWIICVCMWVWVCACVSFHMEGHWGEINHWCTSFELLNTPCCFTTKRSTTLFEREVHHHKRGIFSNVYHCCHQVSLS